MPAAQPAPVECSRKHELAQSLRDVIDHIITLNTEMMEHVTRGNADKMEDLRAELGHARIRKDSLLESYKQHIRVHGC